MLLAPAASVFADGTTSGLILTEASHLKLDRESGYVDMIDGTVTVAELKADFVGDITVAASDGTAKANTEAVATDDKVKAGDDFLTALIYGDVNRDGKVNLADTGAVLKYIAKWNSDISTFAADVDKSGSINLLDASKMLKKIAKWDNISLGNVRMVFENKANKIEGEDKTLQLFFTDMMEKLGRTQTDNNGNNSYKIKLARNETEGCQVLMVADSYREGMTAELTPFVYEYGGYELESKLEWIIYYDHNMAYPIMTEKYKGKPQGWHNSGDCVVWHGDEYPEVVMPMADSFELQENRLQHLIISVTSSKDSPAGMYKADLTIKDAEGNAVKSAPVYAYVWDFTLPDEPYSKSLINVNSYDKGKYGYKDYYDYMLDNNFSGYVLPYDITDERADAYMSDPRVTAFVIAGTTENYGAIMGATDEETKERFEKVMTDPDWARKGLFYYTDEPYGEGLQKVKTTYEHLVDVLGTTEGIRNITPLAGNNTYANSECSNLGIDPVEYIKDYINVWCPSSSAYMDTADGGYFTTRRSLSMYGEYRERAEKFRERGDELWWYVCTGPEIPYTNLFTWYQGVVIRDLMWQQYMNKVEGFLYYGTGVHWDKISKYNFNIFNGDGVLMFPGELFGYEGPQASWRLYQLRDGFDDFDYLKLAEEAVGREAVMKIVNKVTTSMLYYTEEFSDLASARDELADIIISSK